MKSLGKIPSEFTFQGVNMSDSKSHSKGSNCETKYTLLARNWRWVSFFNRIMCIYDVYIYNMRIYVPSPCLFLSSCLGWPSTQHPVSPLRWPLPIRVSDTSWSLADIVWCAETVLSTTRLRKMGREWVQVPSLGAQQPNCSPRFLGKWSNLRILFFKWVGSTTS